jgi:hypothetical protein
MKPDLHRDRRKNDCNEAETDCVASVSYMYQLASPMTRSRQYIRLYAWTPDCV